MNGGADLPLAAAVGPGSEGFTSQNVRDDHLFEGGDGHVGERGITQEEMDSKTSTLKSTIDELKVQIANEESKAEALRARAAANTGEDEQEELQHAVGELERADCAWHLQLAGRLARAAGAAASRSIARTRPRREDPRRRGEDR